MSQLITIEAAAKALSVSKSYLYKLRFRAPGLLPVGRNVRVDLEEFRAWLQTQAEERAQRPKQHRRRKATPTTARMTSKGAA